MGDSSAAVYLSFGPLSALLSSSARRCRLASLAFSLILTGVAAHGQTYIFGRADVAVGNVPTSIAAGDFNGDGVNDLAVTNSADQTVSILVRKPDGTFAPQVTYATGPEPISVVAGDLNGDGNVDLAVTNGNCTPGRFGPTCGPGTVSILLGNGDGTFQTHIDFAVGKLPSSLVAADLNGDGKLDLAVTNALDGTVSVLLGNGDGTFQQQAIYSTAVSSGWQSVVLGDFNGDGKVDLAVSGASVVSVLLGNGDGSFRAHIDSGVGGISLAAGDFNRDGKLDLAVTGGGFLSVLLGNGDGTFILKAQYLGGSAVAASDFKGVGILDLIVSAAGGPHGDTYNSVAILPGNGDGTFQTAINYGTGVLPFGPIAVTDLNGDGKLDLAVADSGCVSLGITVIGNPCPGQQSPPGAISVLLGFGDSTFVGKTDYAVGGGLSLTSADFNKDGNLDLASPIQLSDSVSVLLGNGDGTFHPSASYPVGHLPVSIATGDFRNNGDIDLAVVNEMCPDSPPCNPGSISVLLGNGDGTFQMHADYGVGLVPFGVAVGDFRGNGKLDLVATNNASSSISVLLGNGDGTFQPQVSYLTAPGPNQIATGDFNQDGKLDLAVTAGGSVSILLGNGDGTFKSHVEYPAGGSFGIVAGDFNNDGELDLAVGGSDTVSVLLGNGDGTFKAPLNYPTGVTGAVFALAIADFNQDGKLDLGVNTESVESVILLGNGDGTFQQPIQYLLANLISVSLTVGDFNGDGAPDWAAADLGNTIGVMLSAAFKAISPSSLNFGSQGVGTTSAPRIITVSNPSNVKFSIAKITSSVNFSETNNCGASLSPGANCAISVTFSPTTTGTQTGSITINDSTRISPLAIAAQGNGVNGAFLSIFPSRQNFGPQMVGTSGNPVATSLVNTGNASLSITAISVSGISSSDFTQTNNCGSVLPAGGNCTVNVTFTPTAVGSRMASLTIGDNVTGSPQSETLEGTGLGPLLTLKPSSLSFPSQVVGTNSSAQIVNLSNVGSTSLNIISISASADFTETNTCGTSLAALGNCQISVTFAPTASGNRTGAITISDNAGGSPQSIALSGFATAPPDFGLTPSSGSPTTQTITAGQTASFSLDLTPSGGFTGTVNLTCMITPPVTPAPTCSLSRSSVQITGSGTQSLTVKVGTTAPVTTSALTQVILPPLTMPLAWMLILLTLEPLVRSRKRPSVLTGPAVVLLLAARASCGGSGSSLTTHGTPGTPVGTYTASITATSGSSNHGMALKVIVD